MQQVRISPQVIPYIQPLIFCIILCMNLCTSAEASSVHAMSTILLHVNTTRKLPLDMFLMSTSSLLCIYMHVHNSYIQLTTECMHGFHFLATACVTKLYLRNLCMFTSMCTCIQTPKYIKPLQFVLFYYSTIFSITIFGQHQGTYTQCAQLIVLCRGFPLENNWISHALDRMGKQLANHHQVQMPIQHSASCNACPYMI